MSDDFTTWVQGVLELGLQDEQVREHYREIINQFFVGEIKKRMENPGDDLISVLLQSEIDGEPVPMPIVRGNVGLMLIAGIDTTWSSIGSALWHLATHPEDRQRLVDEPELIPTAVEEFLRAYSPVTMARIATEDTTLGDREIKQGERVLLSFPAANRDPEIFENPEEVIIDRQKNRHVAFGSGVHRWRRIQPGPHGDAGRDRGHPRDDPRIRTVRPRSGDLGRRPGPWPPQPADALPCSRAHGLTPARSPYRHSPDPTTEPGGVQTVVLEFESMEKARCRTWHRDSPRHHRRRLVSVPGTETRLVSSAGRRGAGSRRPNPRRCRCDRRRPCGRRR